MRKMWLAGAGALAVLTAFGGAAFAQESEAEPAPAAPAADDQSADVSTTGVLSPGGSVTATLAPAGDNDWFRIRLAANRTYTFTMERAEGEGGLGDPLLAIVGPGGGEPLAYNDDSNGSLNSTLIFTPRTAGDYFLLARGFLDNAEGRYVLTASQGVAAPRLPADVSADVSTRGRISVGRSVTAALDPAGDQDWYRIRLNAGQPYRFTLNAAGAQQLGDPLLLLIGPGGGEPIAYNDDSNGTLNSLLEFTPQTSGNYFLGVRGFSESATGTYELRAERTAPPPRLALTDGVGSVAGSIGQAGETDRYAVSLTGGQSYRISLTSTEGDSGLPDPLVLLYGANTSQPIAGDDDGGEGLNSYFEFIPPSTGDYTIEARGYSPMMTGGYTLAVRAGDIPDNAQTDVSLSAAGDVRADRLSPAGDKDWFRIDLAEGQSIRIHMTSGEQSGEAPLSDPLVIVRSPDGEMAAVDDDSGEGLNAYLEFTAPAAGTYFIEARGFIDRAEGAYTLRVLPGEIPAGVEGAEPLAANEPRVSQIGAAGDIDWFAVDLVEGRQYRMQAQGGEDEGALADPLLTLHGEDGAVLATDDDGATGVNPQITFTAARTGRHYLAVSAFGNQATGRYAVRLLDSEVPGSDSTDDTLTGLDDARASRIDFPGDRDFYRVVVEAGHSYTVRVTPGEANALADPAVQVLNAAGQEIGSNQDESRRSRAAALTFVAPADEAIVYVVVTGEDDGVGDYELTIAATQ
ncbi:MAG: PPC domain-containing protein [Hyphomonadaceae bacterium]